MNKFIENKTIAPDIPSFDISPLAKMDADEHQPLDVHHQIDEPHQVDEPQPQPYQVAKTMLLQNSNSLNLWKVSRKTYSNLLEV